MAAPSRIPEIENTANQGNQLRFVIDVLLRHRILIAAATLVAGILGAASGVYLQIAGGQSAYNATATLYVKPSLYDSAWLNSLGGSNPTALTPAMIRHQISDRTLAEEVAHALIQEDIEEGNSFGAISSDEEVLEIASRLESELQLAVDPDSGVLNVLATGSTPEYAERRADLASRVLIEHSRRRLLDEQDRVYSAVQGEIQRLREQLDNAEGRQWAFREEIGFQTHAQAWDELEAKTGTLRETLAEREEIQQRLQEVVLELANARANLPTSLGSVSDAAVENLKDELDELIGDRAELQVIYQPGSEAVTPLSLLAEEIDDKREAIRIAVESLGPGGGAWETYKSMYAKSVELEFELADLEIKAATLQNVIAKLEEDIPALADKRFEYEQLVHEADQARAQFGRMVEKQFELKTAQTRETASLERRDAVVVSRDDPVQRASIWSTALTAAAIGFIAAFAFSMMRESMDTSIRTPEDVTQYVGLEVLGTIPLMHFGRGARRRARGPSPVLPADASDLDACVITRYDPKSPISEAYRSLRTNFQFATLQQHPKTVMITSAVPGEGKTTTAVNFAVTMADRGMRVLLVDTDLRRPHVHRVLKMDRGPGLTDVIRNERTLDEAIRSTTVQNLSIISSGRVPPNPSEIIGSDDMRKLIDELTTRFDLVVCDAPSLHVVTDPVLLATHIDTVLLVISVSNARRETIQRAKKFLETANPAIAGVVLNGLEASRRHYYYYYYYYDNGLAHPARSPWYQRL